MFEIYNGQSYLYQWDKNQKLIVYDERVEQVHFANNVLENAIVRDCYTLYGKKVVDVPNKLLETSGRCWAYAYVLSGDEYTFKKEVLTIIEKKKPNDYVEDEEDLIRWNELDKRIKALELNSGGGGSVARIGEVTLYADKWVGDGSLYSQVGNINGVTANSQVDLTPSVQQLVAFYEKNLTFVTENKDGVVTVYAIGQKPQNDYTIQVTITEVYL